jgi:uncharacterized protein YqeY
MTLIERINQDFTASMKAKDAVTLSTLRMLKSALKNKQIDLMHELSEEEALAVVKTQIKQLRDSITDFEKAGRADLAEPAKGEASMLEKYLPAQMDDATLSARVKDALAAAGISAKADTGRAMGVAMKAVAGQADGGRVKAVVESLLACLAIVAVFSALDAPTAHAATQAAAESANYLLPALRITRSFLLLIGLVSVNLIAIGGFIFMTASGRDEMHEHAMEKLAMGAFGTIAVAAMFAIVTNAIERLS